jgi:hypothetical protein
MTLYAIYEMQVRYMQQADLAPNLDRRTPVENSPATSVLGSRFNKPSESLADERNVLPSLAGLYERRALVLGTKGRSSACDVGGQSNPGVQPESH